MNWGGGEASTCTYFQTSLVCVYLLSLFCYLLLSSLRRRHSERIIVLSLCLSASWLKVVLFMCNFIAWQRQREKYNKNLTWQSTLYYQKKHKRQSDKIQLFVKHFQHHTYSLDNGCFDSWFHKHVMNMSQFHHLRTVG